MLVTVARRLYEEDHGAIMDITKSGQSVKLAMADGEHDYEADPLFAHVAGSIYVRVRCNTKSTLDAISRIVELFDQATGLDYRYNILFQLK